MASTVYSNGESSDGSDFYDEEGSSSSSSGEEESTSNPTELPTTNDEVADDETVEKEEKVDENSDSAKSALDGKDKTSQDETMKCEIKHLHHRYDKDNRKYFAEPKKEAKKPAQKDWWRLYAFCIVQEYDKKGVKGGKDHLYINHQPLRQLLHDVIGAYPADPIDVEDVQIQAPYHALFHYRQQLKTEGLKRFEEDEVSLAQVKLLLSWIEDHFEPEIAAYEKCVTRGLKSITYDYMWILFPPYTTVVGELLGQQRAYRSYYYHYDNNRRDDPKFVLSLSYVDFDGEDLGIRKTEIAIHKYTGARDLREFLFMPLSMLEDADEVREALIKRGRKFESYAGQQFLSYDGVGLKKDPKTGAFNRFHVSGRVMVDCKTYHRFDTDDSFKVYDLPEHDNAPPHNTSRKNKLRSKFESKTKTLDKLSDGNAMLTNATVRGYSFTLKRFLEFYVDNLSPIEWNTRCFEELVIDPSVKKMVQALVSSHINNQSSFQDIVKGKGQGLVCVLHGPPGVGKTLTAECVAEYAKRPLYMVSSGDLGSSSESLDAQLSEIMELTSTWGAVLLIDEADVFLEQRGLHDVHRNAMVSVCLRILEYHSGILFLTTNRVATFDEAFKSRIHIPIRYTDLTTESRKQIWRGFCAKVAATTVVDIDDKGFEILAEHDLNGRQIKNIVKTAESLAIYDGAKLDLEQLQQVTKLQAVFDKDMSSLNGVDYTAPGAWRKDSDARNFYA